MCANIMAGIRRQDQRDPSDKDNVATQEGEKGVMIA
jgi:hypothetical protein